VQLELVVSYFTVAWAKVALAVNSIASNAFFSSSVYSTAPSQLRGLSRFAVWAIASLIAPRPLLLPLHFSSSP
jgi:hypothetical protein